MQKYKLKCKVEYVRRVHSQETLKEIALNDPDSNVRRAAVKHITDQEIFRANSFR